MGIQNGQLLLNGRPLLIKGVNRHEHDPMSGKAVSEASIVQDICLMKQYNFNAIRTCHYPNVQRYGMCVWVGCCVRT